MVRQGLSPPLRGGAPERTNVRPRYVRPHFIPKARGQGVPMFPRGASDNLSGAQTGGAGNAMAQSFSCDKCGAEISEARACVAVAIRAPIHRPGRDHHLCPDCARELVAWLSPDPSPAPSPAPSPNPREIPR